MTRVHGKSSNRLYRLDTDRGSFAVKELNLVDRRWTYHADDVFRFEQAAFAAGIPMPEPISADPDVLVHRWAEGDKLPEAPVPAAFAFEIGEILAVALTPEYESRASELAARVGAIVERYPLYEGLPVTAQV